MSTHSLIGKVLDDSGKCKVIYCHSDGYINEPGVGWTLNKYYKKEQDVDKLLKLGDLSFLGGIPEDDPTLWNIGICFEKDDEPGKCRTYKGRGDKGCEAATYNSPREAREEQGQEYNYFYLDNKWYCITDDKIIDLETGEDIKKVNTKMESLLGEKIIRKFNKKWIEDEDGIITEVKIGEKSIKKGDKVGDDFVTGFNPETNTIYLDEDPEVDGGRDYDVETVLSFLEETLNESEDIENIDQDPLENLMVGDKVVLKGFGEDSPWENLSGEVIWMDEEDFPDEFQTITVRVNFPTVDGTREVEQNFDRRNVIKIVEENLTEDTVKQDGKWVNRGEEGTHGEFKTKKEADAQRKAMFANGYKEELEEEKHIETIELPHEEYTSIEDIIRINKELDQKARDGKLFGLRKEKDMLMLAEPAINGIWTLFLNENGGIVKITLW